MSTDTLIQEAPVSPNNSIGPTWLFASLSLLAVIYFPTLLWLYDSWMNDRFYSHGVLVALVCVWLFSQRWNEWRSTPQSTSAAGYPLIVVAMVLVLTGTVSDVMTLSGISLVIAISGMFLLYKGVNGFKIASFPILYFLFAVPVISAASDATGRVLTPMMEFAAAVTASISDLIGLHPFRSGTIIHLPGYTMEVVVPCSGMASVVGLMALAALLGYLSEAKAKRIVLLVVLAVPVALVANIVRLTFTALLGVTCGAKIASGFLHELSGVFTFLVGAAILASIPRRRKAEK